MGTLPYNRVGKVLASGLLRNDPDPELRVGEELRDVLLRTSHWSHRARFLALGALRGVIVALLVAAIALIISV